MIDDRGFWADDTVYSTTTLNYDIYIYVEPTTGEIETVLSFGGFGDGEYDPEADAWVATTVEDTWRIRELTNNYNKYKINWKNKEDFDENMESITLKKYADGTLDEAYLKENTIFVDGPLK
jgi:hypothetical protein